VYTRDDGKICACQSKQEWIINFSEVRKTWTQGKQVGVSNSGAPLVHFSITSKPNGKKGSWQVLNKDLLKKVLKPRVARKNIFPETFATIKFNNRKQYDLIYNGTNWVTPGMNKVENIIFQPMNNRARKDVYKRENGQICACQSKQEWFVNAFAVSGRIQHNLLEALAEEGGFIRHPDAENDPQRLYTRFHTPSSTRSKVQSLKENRAAHEAY
tara:strand:- start:584 stop:1222 length:639 start_codon:yes stop_codon:yes gene_type:complete